MTKLKEKWQEDSKIVPLTGEIQEIYENIHTFYFSKLKCFPDLVKPQDFNSKIQWLKLFDQSKLHVSLSDKVVVRHYIETRIGAGFTPTIFAKFKRASEIANCNLPTSYVLKVNNNSGTVFLIKDGSMFNLSSIKSQLEQAINLAYGWKYGEWMYSYIQPQIFAEEYIGPVSNIPPADFKFHCVNGKIKWIQYIEGRGNSVSKEINVDINGKNLDFHFNTLLGRTNEFNIPHKWEEMKDIAEKLSAGWKYLRVDMYQTHSRIFVGELTFFPLGGFLSGEGQKIAGKMLDFSTDDFKPFVINELENTLSRHKIYSGCY